MKKAASVISVAAALIIAFSGCGTGAQSPGQGLGSAPSSPANGQRQFARADLSGQVTSITGNQITIKVMETQGRGNGQGGSGQFNRGNGGSQQNGNQSNNNSQNNGGQSNGSQNNSGQSNGSQNPNGGQSNGQQRQRGQNPSGGWQRMAPRFTGETKTVTVPDGVDITTFSKGQNRGQGSTGSKITLKDIKQGDILQVWYSDQAKQKISRITVIPGSAFQGGQSGQGNGNGGNSQNDRNGQGNGNGGNGQNDRNSQSDQSGQSGQDSQQSPPISGV